MWNLRLPACERTAPFFSRRVVLALHTLRQPLAPLAGSQCAAATVALNELPGVPSATTNQDAQSEWQRLDVVDSGVQSYPPMNDSLGGVVLPSRLFFGSDAVLYALQHRSLDPQQNCATEGNGDDCTAASIACTGKNELRDEQEKFQVAMRLAQQLTCGLDRVLNVTLNSEKDHVLLGRQYIQLVDELDRLDGYIRSRPELVERIQPAHNNKQQQEVAPRGSTERARLRLEDCALLPVVSYMVDVCGMPVGPFSALGKYLKAAQSTGTWKDTDSWFLQKPAASLEGKCSGTSAAQTPPLPLTANPLASARPPPAFVYNVDKPHGILRLVMNTIKESTTVTPQDTFVQHPEGSLSRTVLASQRLGEGRLSFQSSVTMVKTTDRKVPRHYGAYPMMKTPHRTNDANRSFDRYSRGN